MSLSHSNSASPSPANLHLENIRVLTATSSASKSPSSSSSSSSASPSMTSPSMSSPATESPVSPASASAKFNLNLDPFGFPQIPHRGHYQIAKCDERRQWVEQFTGTKLEHLGHWWHDTEKISSSSSVESLRGNIESPIGLVKIPCAAAGPLLFHGNHVKGLSLLPIATTEGALVASITRGATALNRAGGVRAEFLGQRMIRAPRFFFETREDVERVMELINNPDTCAQLISALHAHAISKVSRNAKLVALEAYPYIRDNSVDIRFIYTTGDAAGQNMTTTTTDAAIKLLQRKIFPDLNIKVISSVVEGQLSCDKKASLMNFNTGRGAHARASVNIPASVLKSVLKVDRDHLLDFWQDKESVAKITGLIGFNINIANVIAGAFIALGQDVASVHESSVGDFHLVPWEDPVTKEPGITATMDLPCLVIGTIGGGTALHTQRECLEMIGCYGAGGVARLAEILAGYCLALDLSTLSAIASNQFARAHERLGRNRPDLGLNPSMIRDQSFFRNFLHFHNGPSAELVAWKQLGLDSSTGIISDMSEKESNKLLGHFAFEVVYSDDAECRPASFEAPNHHDSSSIYSAAQALRRSIIAKVNHASSSSSGSLALSKTSSSTATATTTTTTTPDSSIGKSDGKAIMNGNHNNTFVSHIVVKSKPTDRETINLFNRIANVCGGEVASTYQLLKFRTAFKNGHVRELAVMTYLHGLCQKGADAAENILPSLWGVMRDDKREIFVLATDRLIDAEAAASLQTATQRDVKPNVRLLNSVEQAPTAWSIQDIQLAFRDLAAFHALHLSKATGKNSMEHLTTLKALSTTLHLEIMTGDRTRDLAPLRWAMMNHIEREFPEIWTASRASLSKKILEMMPEIIDTLVPVSSSSSAASSAITLIHGDFNPRNVCIRLGSSAGQDHLCAYDWELATLHIPQRDLIEFLVFVMDPAAPISAWNEHIEFYRQQLASQLNATNANNTPAWLRPECFRLGLQLALAELIVDRLAMYSMAHTVKDYSNFLPRVIAAAFNYLQASSFEPCKALQAYQSLLSQDQMMATRAKL